jgi:hypothetical protein
MRKFVESEDEEKAIKADAKILVGVDEAVLAEAKADEKAHKKAKREEKKAKTRVKPVTSAENPEDPSSNA